MGKIMNIKERMAIARQTTKEIPANKRIRNFSEVVSGFDAETAMREAERCLQCKKPKCREGCPIHNDIPGVIKLIREGKEEEAYWKDRETNSLPAICGRVCPQEFQCEGLCIRGKTGEPVAIGMLERYMADWMVANRKNILKPCALPKNEKVAIIGSGPAGMTAAYVLAHAGYHCTIFESLSVPGGMLMVGIPAYRLPRIIVDSEFEALKNCGVEIITGVTIGKDKSLTDLKNEGFNAAFIGVGAHISRKLEIEGEELSGVIHGVDYLCQVNVGGTTKLGKNVVVIGGGNVAIDCARTALRSGADQVSVIYRRSRDEMPASKIEIHHLEEEGVKIEVLAAPIKIHGPNGISEKIECIRMKLGECDESGRCRPVPVENSHFIIPADTVIPAISQDVDTRASSGTDLEMTRWNTYVVDPVTMQTSEPWIFAGGDAVLGPQTVAKAIFQGKEAAESIIRFLEGRDLKEQR